MTLADPLEARALLDHITDPDELRAAVRYVESLYGQEEPVPWLRRHFPQHTKHSFAPHHLQFWDWIWALRIGAPARPFFGVWSRGGAKSTNAELGVVALGARRARKYVLYVCETQDQADDHVGNIGAMLSSRSLERVDPELTRRAVTKYGSSRGWRRNHLHTDSGLTVDALGLDSAARGAKVDEERPDMVILDDVDEQHDSPGTVRKKLRTIGRSILLAGSADLAVLGIQNLIHPDGVFAQVIDGRAEMLANRIMSGPIPALEGAVAIEAVDVEDHEDPSARPWRILSGTPTWDGQGIPECEALLAIVGPTNFRVECQHETALSSQGMFADVLDHIAHVHRNEVPDLVRKAIAVDPATTDTDNSDSHGVQLDGIDRRGVIYRLRSWEQRATPGTALEKAVEWAYEEGVSHVLVEMVGSDMTGRSVERSWEVAFDNAVARVLERHPEWELREEDGGPRPRPKIERVKATAGTGSKANRASAMHTDYEAKGRIVHVIGDHLILEAALGRAFEVKPFDLVDASFYSWRSLRRMRRARTASPAKVERMGLPAGFNPNRVGLD